MKLSIAWIFDHIDAQWRSLDIHDLVARFNKTTAEIETVQHIAVDLDTIYAAHIVSADARALRLRIIRGEQTVEATLPARADLTAGQWTLVVGTHEGYRWAHALDLGGQRGDLLLPALQLDDSSDWKTQIECDDYILTVDNKSITHRPDMWGHRGFAREIAAMFDLPLKPLEAFLAPMSVVQHDTRSVASDALPWSISINVDTPCNAIAFSYIDTVSCQPSSVTMATRLIRVDMRSINALVDTTNYVMADIGQPMHAFNAHALQSKNIIIRTARDQESLQILDNTTLTLTTEDMVIADGNTPVSLAGIMGGLHSGISASTTAVLLEAGSWDATIIRRSAERHKLRTQASARYEKNLDPAQTIHALQRFVRLAQDVRVPMHVSSVITVLGVLPQKTELHVAHAFIQARLGVSLPTSFVLDTLKKLEFQVTMHDAVYTVQVPTFRATKDIAIEADIVEEIGRFYGYDAIPPQVPTMRLEPHDLTPIMRLRSIKQYLAYACQMSELYSYAFYDESFLTRIGFVPQHTLQVQDPVSNNWQRLVTSLIPHLSKAVHQNATTHDQLRFFEWGRTWDYQGSVTERKKLAGIMFDKRTPIDFYKGKTIIEDMLSMLGLHVRWQQVTHPYFSWHTPYTTAELIHDTQTVGCIGLVPAAFMALLTEGYALVFEIDGDFLINGKGDVKRYIPTSKFPDVLRDVSVLIGRQHSVASLLTVIAGADTRVASVVLVDFFEKDEWADKRSVSFRYILRDTTKTMTTDEVDTISERIAHALTKLGGMIR